MTDLTFGVIPIEKIKKGMTVSYSQTITDADIKAYAGLSGDHNPIHVSKEYAIASRYGKRIAHGLMSAGFFSALYGNRFPGPGSVYVSQNLKFKRPVYIDGTVVSGIEVSFVDVVKRRVFFDTTCTVRDKVVIQGEAEMSIPTS